MMNNIFRDLIAKEIVVVYLDNILIFTRMVKEHAQVVWRVLEILTEHRLFLHPKKCEFQKTQIKYLRLIISESKVAINSVKVSGV